LSGHDWRFLDKEMRIARGVHKLTFNEARLMVVDKTCDANSDGWHQQKRLTIN
jgi:hypothetical protein